MGQVDTIPISQHHLAQLLKQKHLYLFSSTNLMFLCSRFKIDAE